MRAGVAVSDDQPVLNTIAEITAVSLARGTLDAREHMIARLAALIAVDAPTVSYVLNFEPAAAALDGEAAEGKGAKGKR